MPTAVLQIRESEYRGEKGWTISGTVEGKAFPQRVFVPESMGREAAEAIREKMKAGEEWSFKDYMASKTAGAFDSGLDYGFMVTHEWDNGSIQELSTPVFGPRNISEETRAALSEGAGGAFQLWDDDKELMATGRWFEGDGDRDPLADYGEAMFGATRMTVGSNQPFIGKRKTATQIAVRDEYDDEGSLTLWSGGFASDFEGWAERTADGYKIILEYGGSTTIEAPVRDDSNYNEVDAAINAAVQQLRATGKKTAMNGEVRPATVRALNSRTVVSLKDGVTVEIQSGEEFTGFLNQYGNFYNDAGVYIGSVPSDFEEVGGTTASKKTAGATIKNIKKQVGVAGQFAYTAEVQYDDEEPMFVSFYGMLPRGNNLSVIMEMNGNQNSQTYVSDPTRFGQDLNEEWVRNFFATASKKKAIWTSDGREANPWWSVVDSQTQEVIWTAGSEREAQKFVNDLRSAPGSEFGGDRLYIERMEAVYETEAKLQTHAAKTAAPPWMPQVGDRVTVNGNSGEIIEKDMPGFYTVSFDDGYTVTEVSRMDMIKAGKREAIVFPWEKKAVGEIAETDEFPDPLMNGDDGSYARDAEQVEEDIVMVEKKNERLSGLDGFWEAIDVQIEQLSKAKSADEVIDILGGKEFASSGDAFFAGSGGDQSVYGALLAAGWKIVWYAASYYFAAEAPDGSGITYVEGDIYKGIQERI